MCAAPSPFHRGSCRQPCDSEVAHGSRRFMSALRVRSMRIGDGVAHEAGSERTDARHAAAEGDPSDRRGRDRAEAGRGLWWRRGEPMATWEACPAVERNPRKISGAWAFSGTRVPVYALFENLESGATVKQFLEWYPEVKAWQVAAVLKQEAEYFKAPDHHEDPVWPRHPGTPPKPSPGHALRPMSGGHRAHTPVPPLSPATSSRRSDSGAACHAERQPR